jgi:hypothetical protein
MLRSSTLETVTQDLNNETAELQRLNGLIEASVQERTRLEGLVHVRDLLIKEKINYQNLLVQTDQLRKELEKKQHVLDMRQAVEAAHQQQLITLQKKIDELESDLAKCQRDI